MSAASLAAYVPAREGDCLIELYINLDSHEAYTEPEVGQSCDDMAQLATDGSAAQAAAYEQWLDIDACSGRNHGWVNWHFCHGLDFWASTTDVQRR